MLMSGIDVSHYQNKVDWKNVQKAGIVFAFIKASEGATSADPLFDRHWNSARQNKILRGAYHFFRPQSDPLAQAELFLDAICDDPGELPPTLDLEALGNVSPDRAISNARRWMNIVEEQLNRKPILYTGSAFFRISLANCNAFADNPLWIAHYTSRSRPLLPSAWSNWTFWQFSQNGRVPGINGNVDLNAFNGSLPELETLCSVSKNSARKMQVNSA
jgi:lysozyme